MDIKRIYERALSPAHNPHETQEALREVLRSAVIEPSHFHFLIENVPWFTPPYLAHINILEKTLRIYQGMGKGSERVAYNLLLQGICMVGASRSSAQCLINLVKQKKDHAALFEAIRDNYPHKLVEEEAHLNYIDSLFMVMQELEDTRVDLLEIIFENLAQLDTEHRAERMDSNKLESVGADESGSTDKKLDNLLVFVIKKLEEVVVGQEDFKCLLAAFERVLFFIDEASNLPLLLFYFAEKNPVWAKICLTLILGGCCQKFREKRQRNIFKIAVSYLTFYVRKSNLLSQKLVSKICNMILTEIALPEMQNTLTVGNPSQKTNLEEMINKNFHTLMMIKSVKMITKKLPQKKREQVMGKLREQLRESPLRVLGNYFFDDFHEDGADHSRLPKSRSEVLKKQIYIKDIFQNSYLHKYGSLVNKILPLGETNETDVKEKKEVKLEDVKQETKEEQAGEKPTKKVKRDWIQ